MSNETAGLVVNSAGDSIEFVRGESGVNINVYINDRWSGHMAYDPNKSGWITTVDHKGKRHSAIYRTREVAETRVLEFLNVQPEESAVGTVEKESNE